MAYFETPELPQPKAMPHYMVGAASPLWAYFGAAAAGGVAFWWMTRWTRPANLEAMFAAAAPAVEPVVEAAEEVVATVAEAPVAIAEAVAEPVAAVETVAEIAPDLAAASDPTVDTPSEPVAPVLELVPEPVIETAPEVVEAAPEPVEAAPDPAPLVEAAPKPRVRKAAPPAASDET